MVPRYATLGVAVPGGQKQVFQTKIYGEGPNEDGVDSNEGYFDVIELYRGTPRGLIVNSILQAAATPARRAQSSPRQSRRAGRHWRRRRRRYQSLARCWGRRRPSR